MTEKEIEFAHDPKKCAQEYVQGYSAEKPDCFDGINMRSAKKMLQEALDIEESTMAIMWKLGSMIRAPKLALVAASLLTSDQVKWREDWNAQPEKFRSFMRVAASIDLGFLRGWDKDRSSGRKVKKSNETIRLEKFESKIEEEASLSSLER